MKFISKGGKRKMYLVDSNGQLKIKKSRKSKTEIAFILFGISIPIISVIFFWIIINFQGILLAFQEKVDGSYIWGLGNFKYLWEEVTSPTSKIMEGLKNTLIFFVFSTFLQLPTTYAISFFIYKKVPFANGFRYIFMIPAIVSAVVLTSFVKFMLAADGPVSELIYMMTGDYILLLADSRYALTTLLVYQFWSTFGSGIILYVATFARIPQQLVEAGRLDGLSFWGEIKHVVFPLTWPFFSTMLLLQFSGIFGAGGPVLLFTKGQYGTYTLSYWIFEQTQGGNGVTRGACLGLVLTCITLPIILVFKRWADSIEPIEY